MSETPRITHKLIPERASSLGGRLLGRHIHFDERSRKFPVQGLPEKGAALKSRVWLRRLGPFDQGSLSSCVGNAAVGLLATAPFRKVGETVNEQLAVGVYGLATTLDPFPGSYPYDDTGSSVLAGMKALKQRELITAYHWCFGLVDVLQTLATIGPVAIGVSWYTGFDTPNPVGICKISGDVRGGHAFDLIGLDTKRKLVIAENSWGPAWGQHGRFLFSFDDLDRLLREDGEASTIVR